MFTEKEMQAMKAVSEDVKKVAVENEATDAMSSGCSWG